MKIKLILMMIHDFLIRRVGICLIIIGITGHIVNYNFDRIVGRSSLQYQWNWLQWLFFMFCWFMIIWGWIVEKYYRDVNKDIREED